MEAKVKTMDSQKKEWVAPELEEISVAEITANNFSANDDGNGPGSGVPS